MEFRRSGHRDERRRRVLMEERRGTTARREPAWSTSRRTDSHDERAPDRCGGYSTAALDREQPPVTYLIPKRPWTLTVIVLSGLTLIAGVQFLYSSVFQTASRSQQAVLAALDVAAPGSLMGWTSSLFLLVAAAGSVMVYALRRHRLDDYRGRYRVWLWSASACSIASIDAATGLHGVLSRAINDLTRTPLYGDGSIWWLLVFAMVFGTGMVRILVEVRGSFSAVFGILLAGAGYVSGGLVELHLLLPGGGLLSQLVQSSCVMLAHLGIALAVLAYCRHVHREAQREMSRAPDTRLNDDEESPRRSRPQSRRQTGSVRIDAAHDTPAHQSKAGAGESPDVVPEIDGEAETSDNPRLSKSERRRLRKESRRKRRSA
ncbi:MAG: hypothetical protein ACC628_12200 [Pirellulaceae bacterium]